MFLSKAEDRVVQFKLTSYGGGVWKTEGKCASYHGCSTGVVDNWSNLL